MIDERVVPGITGVLNLSKHIARYNAALQLCQNMDVIDASCGCGYGSWLLSQVAKSVIGLDISEKAIEYAYRNYRNRTKIKYFVRDFNTMNIWDPESCDILVSFETIEHLEDPQDFIKKVKDVLRPGGVFIFSVPLNESAGANPYHKHIFTKEKAEKVVSNDLELTHSFIQRGISFYPMSESPDGGGTFFYGIATK